MRPGLVAVGVGFLLLGAGAVSAFVLFPPKAVRSEDATAVGPVPTPPGTNPHAAVITGITTDGGTLTVRWHATSYVEVDLYDVSNCPEGPTACPLPPPSVSWAANTSGTWGTTGHVEFPVLLTWTDLGNATVNFSATADESWDQGASVPMVTLLLVYGSGAVLAAVGGIAVFLGLFLRGGVYQGPAPLVSRSADDAEQIAGQSGRPGGPPK